MTRIPIVTFSTGYGSTAVEIDAELLRAAEQALEEERRRQARDPAAEATRKPTTETPNSKSARSARREGVRLFLR